MGNIQVNEKQSKTGKSPGKSKHFMRNLKGRDSKKHGRKKSDAKREVIDRDFDKTPDSDNIEQIENISVDNDLIECVFKTLGRQGEGADSPRVQSEVTVTRCEARSPTRDQSPVVLALPALSPANDSTSESVFTDPLTPLAVELNQCYYSAESDSAPDDLPRTLSPHIEVATSVPTMTIDMPHEETTSSLSVEDMEKEEKNDVFGDSTDKAENEKVMGSVFSGLCGDNREEFLERSTHECNHEFRENRLKACAGQTSFTVSKHRKVELPPVEPSLTLLDNVVSEKDRRHSSVSDTPMTESNVLRKVASLTLDKLTESRVIRPKFVPDKLDFKLYEKFEGQMLLNWFISSITENSHLKTLLSVQDLRNLGIQYCTHLLAAGVLRQISDKDAPIETIFKPNLMYYWAHMEVPTLQPVTPGRLHTSVWPPDKDTHMFFSQDNQRDLENNKFFSPNNNEEINDMDEAKLVISQLKKKLRELEIQLEKNKITSQIESLNKNLEKRFDSINEYNLVKIKPELKSIEVQTSNIDIDIDKLSNNKAVITIPDNDTLRTNVNIDRNLDISSLEYNSEMAIENITKPDVRSERIVNYCKLNKSREYNNILKKDEILEPRDYNEPQKSINQYTPSTHDSFSSSNNSFQSTCASTDLSAYSAQSFRNEESTKSASIFATEILYTTVKKNSPVEFSNRILEKSSGKDFCKLTSKGQETPNSSVEHLSPTVLEMSCNQGATCLPPPLPGMTPPPPPTPGTPGLCPPDMPIHDTSSLDLSSTHVPCEDLSSANDQASGPTSVVPLDSNSIVIPPPTTSTFTDPKISTQCVGAMSPPASLPVMSPRQASKLDIGSQVTPTVSSVSFSPAVPSPEHVLPLNTETETKSILASTLVKSPLPGLPPSLPMLDMSLPSPMISGTGPPPLMPGIYPPPPPMTGMCPPPPPPMPEMMGPPPPPMPGMGPPPPPMPGMGPPPPPMPGMGPPPPPMPGMGPPPPPMPGMGPPPPPMPGMGPPPPPMPGMGPPPPPMPGMGPTPPQMPGVGAPSLPTPGMGPPPPPSMPGMGPLPPSIPGMGPPPPPPFSGPVPFPAPPVGGWNVQRATLRKTAIKPSAPMKPLYWTRILAAPTPPTGQGESCSSIMTPLWLEIEETALDNIEEFTDLFSRQVVKAPVKKKVEVKTKRQPVKILDGKRSQNVGILAQSLHVEFSEIENAIYNFDTSVVSLEALQQIYELRGSEEELSLIKDHMKNKPDEPLDKPEAFLHDLSGIPNFAARISCFMFQAEFEDSISTTMHKLDNLKHTCEFLSTNENLKKLFAIILTLGNYMNGGNGQRGQADGFGLEILSKLKDVKSKQSNVTLLHFIVRTYIRTVGGALDGSCALPVPEPGDIARAAALDFADVAAHLATLRTHLDGCKEKMEKIIEDHSQTSEECGDESKRRMEVFKDKMTAFINAAEEKLKTEDENLEECRNKFVATVKFYQYIPKCGKVEDCEPKDFFSFWTSFCCDLKDIYKKEVQIAIKEKLKEAKKLQEERKPLTQPKREGGLKSRLQKLSSTTKK